MRAKRRVAEMFKHDVRVRIGAGLLAAVLVFALGVGVGQGRISIGASSANNTSLPDKLDYSSVNNVYKLLKEKYDGKLTEAQLLNGLKAGLAEATNDPYTEYFTPKQAQQFSDELNNSFTGIGAELSQDSDKNIVIVAPIAGFPAAKAGLQPRDIITDINGQSTSGMAVDAAVNKIRGPKGTKVTLKVLRGSDTHTFTVTRTQITVPSVTTKILPGNIGYMQVSSFADDTSDLVKQAGAKFKKQHVSGVILDLRNNPGGLVDAAVDLSSLWLPDGKTIMQEKHDGHVTHTYSATGEDTLRGVKTVVLVNGGSASASEITAGALHDNGAATIIGTKTYGKGVVQELNNFSDGSELKVTVASWYRPNGQNINKKGITPDKIVKLNEADAKAGNDPQLDAAKAYLQR